ncbi:nose resistant to fluoxetine protein 6-like [Thrips palmi]|uniref:Nose resistant to fluoxetine protein 6-like n=1 Tax=Thrips palmi TaxID=161013 RepID=A0A6P8YHR9_THRPL|nr:nose resistant to fluoxetine protein 6-like [Thrips palmi]
MGHRAVFILAFELLVAAAAQVHGGAPAAGQLAPSRLVPWPSWIGTWLADAADEADIHPEDRQCAADSRLVMEHFHNHSAWAARMLDASSAGPSPGLLRGVTDSLGDFDECLGLAWPHATAAPVEPQYCLVTLRTDPFRPSTASGTAAWGTVNHVGPYANVHAMMKGHGQHRAVVPLGRLRFGVCLPASCSAEAVNRAARRHPQSDGDVRWAAAVEHPKFCTRRHHVTDGSSTRMVLAGVTVLIALLVLAGSIIDLNVVAGLKKVQGLQGLSAFAMRRQWADLTQPAERDSIPGLSGLKTYMCVGVVVFHHFLVQEGLSVGANSFAAPADGSPPLLVTWIQDSIHNGMVHFFFFSGYLMVRAGHDARLLAPLRRAIRFLPLLAAMTLVQAVVLPAWSSGPAWRWRMDFERDDCRAAWWRTLLYINNFGPRGPPTCVLQLWSMAVDLQCFTACQLSMWLWSRWKGLGRSPKPIQGGADKSTSSPQGSQDVKGRSTGAWSSGELLGASLAVALTLVVRVGMGVYYKWPLVLPMNHVSAAHLENAPELFGPHTPMSNYLLSYVLGGVTAILVKPLYQDSNSTKISKTVGNVGFALLWVLMIWRGVVSYEAWRDAVNLGPVQDSLASTLRQVLTCLIAAAQVILLEPRFTRLNVWQWVLGQRLLVVLHRLTPLVYLVHMLPIMTTALTARGPVQQDTSSLISGAATIVVQSFILAVVAQLALLGPLTSLLHSWARPRSTDNLSANCGKNGEKRSD